MRPQHDDPIADFDIHPVAALDGQALDRLRALPLGPFLVVLTEGLIARGDRVGRSDGRAYTFGKRIGSAISAVNMQRAL